ncbi:hypothetical protein [Arthrobacter sp. L77]|uniref:hypothetical protein n=1 Tax=Arthrobacter sp. L77 TaxID=1496689 RepID=UPI0012E00303|nr:hypothetical protein [Arthrobacter sp. L77]
MKLCFIGDSHLGHIKPAWETVKVNLSNISIAFRVERTYGEKPLTITSSFGDSSPTVLEDIRLAHSPEVGCDQWDAFVVFGMHYSIASLAAFYKSYRSDKQALDKQSYLLSQLAYESAVADLYACTKASRVIEALQQKTDRPIYYSQQAHPLDWVIERPDLAQGQFSQAVANGDDLHLARDYEDRLAELERNGVIVVRQPEATKKGAIFTRKEYGLADASDTSPNSAYAKGDYFHMNELYGRAVLNQLLPRLGVVI